MSNFFDQALQLMEQILVDLEREAKQIQIGSKEGIESADNTLLRIIGLINSGPQIDNQQLKIDAAEQLESFVQNYFKIQRNGVAQDLKEINQILKIYRKRLGNYNKAKISIKLNRLRKLLEEPTLDRDKLIRQTTEDTRYEVGRQFKKIKETGKIQGLVNNEIEGHEAIVESADKITGKLPNEIIQGRNILVQLLRSQSVDSLKISLNLEDYKAALQKEVYNLENFENLLFKGQLTYDGNTKLSLSRILDLLIFLTNRQRVHYNCSQCKFYLQSKNSVCIYAGDGKHSLTSTVTVTNSNGKEVTGKLTKTNNSCKEVWGIDTNDYFQPSESLTSFAKKILQGE